MSKYAKIGICAFCGKEVSRSDFEDIEGFDKFNETGACAVCQQEIDREDVYDDEDDEDDFDDDNDHIEVDYPDEVE